MTKPTCFLLSILFIFISCIIAALVILRPPGKRRVMVIGLDGVTWNMLDPMIEDGRLPNFKHMVDNGSTGVLWGSLPLVSPLIWTTMVTGFHHKVHGIDRWQFKVPGTARVAPPTSDRRRTKALWNILTDNDMSTYYVNWMASWPAEEIKGLSITNKFPDDSSGKDIYPKKERDKLQKLAGTPDEESYRRFISKYIAENPDDFLKIADNPDLTARLGLLKKYFMEESRVVDLTLGVLDEYPFPDLFLTYLHGTDAMSHYFIGYEPYWDEDEIEPSILVNDPETVAIFSKVTSGYYEYVDYFLGEILKKLPPDVVLIVVSDHGFIPLMEPQVSINFNRIFAHWGLLAYDDKGKVDLSGTVAHDFSKTQDKWGRSIFINRDALPEGADIKTYRQQLAERMKAIKLDGNVLCENYKINNNPRLNEPDIDMFCNLSTYGKLLEADGEVLGPSILLSINKNMTGKHDWPGVVLMYGPGVKKGFKMERHSTNDICKTLLFTLGLPVGENMIGEVIRDGWSDWNWRYGKIRTIKSYGHRKNIKIKDIPEGLHDEELERLKALGYIK